MKLAFVLLTAGFLNASAAAISQNITYSAKNASLESVFSFLEQHTSFVFLYGSPVLKASKPVTVSASNMPFKDFLDSIFEHQPLGYTVKGQSILVFPKSAPDKGSVSRIPDLPKDSLIEVRGTVEDESGEPLVGMNVTVKGTTKGVATDTKGEFRIKNVKPGSTLVFSFVGYSTKEVPATEGQPIKIRLHKSVSNLEQAVVIAYGTVQKKDLTGSVSTINTKDVQDMPFNTIDNALAGKASGVQVTKTDGTPGGAVRVRVRGSTSLLGGNDPLYVIDGVPIQVQSNYISPGFDIGSTVGVNVTGQTSMTQGTTLATAFVNGLNSLGNLNIDDIESITVLKDASSTAIYGSKAANGVVVINTKRGKKGMPAQISASYYTTYTSPKLPHVLDGDQYRTLITEAATNSYKDHEALGTPQGTYQDAIVNTPGLFFGNGNTNWAKLITRNTYSQNAEISLQGGSASSKYFSSISYNTTPGVVRGSDYQRITGKVNLENEIGKKFRFITNILMGYTNQNITSGAYDQALLARPDLTPYDSSGAFTNFAGVGQFYQNFQNPLALIKATNNAKTTNLLGTLSAVYDILPGMQFKSMASLNRQDYDQRNYTPSFLLIMGSGNGSVLNGNVDNPSGIGGNSHSLMTGWIIENTLSYDKTFRQSHALNILLGTSYESHKVSSFSATGTGYPNDNALTSLSSAVTPLTVQGDNPTMPQSFLLSYYARVNYAFKDKYLFTLTGRADGSSKFGPENKFGYFPSGAVAWRLSQEDFLKRAVWLDDLKIRGSYGLTGTQNIGDQMYRSLFSPYNYDGLSALVISQIGNPAIKWESTREADGGLDISVFGGRAQATIDYYHKETNGALLALPVAPSSAVSSLLSNSVGVRNSGWEIALQGDLVRTRDFKWTASVNVTWNRSMVTKLPPDADLGQIGNLTGLEVGNTTLIKGQPLGLITGSKVVGIIHDQKELSDYKKKLGIFANFTPYVFLGIGDPMYQLTAGNGYGYPNNDTIIGHGAPKYYGGFSQGFTYKNFDLQLYFTFSVGGQLLWGDHVSSTEFLSTANASTAMLNRYTPQNPNSNEPRLTLDAQYYKSNLDLFSSTYLKLRSVIFSYHLNQQRWMTNAGLKNVSFFVSGMNLLTITKYPGNDPETSDDPYSVTGGYIDVSNYPVTRSYSAGVKLSF